MVKPQPPSLTSLPRLAKLWCHSICIIIVVVVMVIVVLAVAGTGKDERKESTVCVTWRGRGLWELGGREIHRDRKDGRKVKDWGKQMCTCA